MDLFEILFICLVSFLVGIIATFVVQYYILYTYFEKEGFASSSNDRHIVRKDGAKKPLAPSYSLPEALKNKLLDSLEDSSSLNDSNNSLPISLVLQFLFHELRHSEGIKRWLYKKLTMELDELLTKTTIGKFFDSINIKDMNLGSQFPDIKDISVDEVKLDSKEGHIDLLSLCLNLDYTGNFLLSIDAKMKFGKTAYLSIKVKKISGLARLQFSRHPYTHWSFSFYTEPVMDLAVESHFQGRQLQSNITNLICNQIKKAIRRKHTLPNYKIRYKPFFVKTDPSQLDLEDNEILLPQGQLEVTCMEITRLEVSDKHKVHNIHFTLAVDTISWICVYLNPQDNRKYMILEITVGTKQLKQTQLGVIFRQEPDQVVVESVSPQSSASRAGLKRNDVVLVVENKQVTTVPQVAKLIKSTAVASSNVTLRVERLLTDDTYVFKKQKQGAAGDVAKSTTPCSDTEDVAGDLVMTQSEHDSFVIVDRKETNSKLLKMGTKMIPGGGDAGNMTSKFAQTLGNFTLRKRKTSVGNDGGSTGGKTTPNSSSPGTPQHNFKHHSISVPSTLNKKNSISEVPEFNGGGGGGDVSDCEECYSNSAALVEIFKSRTLDYVDPSTVLCYNEDFLLNLRDKGAAKYLNVNVWGTSGGDGSGDESGSGGSNKEVLLGYTNIPISHILNGCSNSVLGHYVRSYSFLPPLCSPPGSQSHPLMSHSGFEHVFCYGDILLSFTWSQEDVVFDDDVQLLSAKKQQQRKVSAPNLENFDTSSSTNSTSTEGSSRSATSGVIKHDFIRTQFHGTTHCDFCSKKIWLKDAVQCRQCALCCHKKCVAKCQLATPGCCVNSNTKMDDAQQQQSQPEIILTDGDYDDLTLTAADDVATPPGAMKRVNSAKNLAIPPSQANPSSSSRSLPPSPARTPTRKHSINLTNPFEMCPAVLDEVAEQRQSSDAVQRLLEQVMQCPNDESLMDVAKETGIQMYAHMSHLERVDKINLMMAELKKTLDAVTLEHLELSKQMCNEESEGGKTKLVFLMGQADAKVHALSVLMLHYCSSLQHTQEKIV